MIENLPFEILLEISKYLDLKSYHRFRQCNHLTASFFSKTPTLFLSSLKTSFHRQIRPYLNRLKEKEATAREGRDGLASSNSTGDGASAAADSLALLDPSDYVHLDQSESSNLNAFQFLVRFGFNKDFSRILKQNSKKANHLSLGDLEILMGIATDGIYDSSVTCLNLNEDFNYNPDVVYDLITYRPYAYTKTKKSLKASSAAAAAALDTSLQMEQEAINASSIILSQVPATQLDHAAAAASHSSTAPSASSAPVKRIKKTFDNHWRVMQLITISCFQRDFRTFTYFAPKLFQNAQNPYLPLLNCALARNCSEIAMYILDVWPSINPALDDNTSITLACKMGMDAVVTRLLEFSLVAPDLSCALAAVTFDHSSVLDILLADARLDPSLHSNVLLGIFGAL